MARSGGEEFVALIADASPEQTRRILERIREQLIIVLTDGSTLPFTASFGADFPTQENSLDDIIRHGDKALFQAKRAGRNRIVIAGEPVDAADAHVEVAMVNGTAETLARR